MTLDTSNNEFISLSLLLKATPVVERGQRFIYCEASNESLDQQNEVVLQKSLENSMQNYIERGNFDIDHVTLTGPKLGINDYLMYEIGRPTDVKFHGDKTLVKGIIYSGEGIAAEKANMFWSSLTEINPPARWYPSVGGSIQASELSIDQLTKSRQRKITKVRWSNIGFSRQPVNASLPSVSTATYEQFAKSWAADGYFTKTLEAGYGTDVSQLTGGAALRIQSLNGYTDYRDKVSALLLNGVISANQLLDESVTRFGLTTKQATAWTKQFLTDLTQRRS
jgi:hypothetical protein